MWRKLISCVFAYDFSNHFSFHFVHLDAFKVHLGSLHIHLSLLGDGDAIMVSLEHLELDSRQKD